MFNQINEITAEELKERLDKNESIILLDVREDMERNISHIGGMHIPLTRFLDHINELEKVKDEEIIVYCKSGGRSAQVCAYLQQQGYNVTNLRGGIIDWAYRVEPGMKVG